MKSMKLQKTDAIALYMTLKGLIPEIEKYQMFGYNGGTSSMGLTLSTPIAAFTLVDRLAETFELTRAVRVEPLLNVGIVYEGEVFELFLDNVVFPEGMTSV